MAAENLVKIYEELIENDFLLKNSSSIIDVTKYEDVPLEYVNGKKITPTNTAKPTGVGSFATATKTYHRNTAGFTTTPPPPEPKPCVFERNPKSKKPSQDELSALADKVSAIMEDNFEAKLPDILEEGDDIEEISYNRTAYGHDYAGYV
jgi:hypothetical protein